MNLDELKNIISECALKDDKIFVENRLHDVIEFLKNDYSYKMLKSITAVDLGDEIELIYKLFSVEDEEEVLLSINVQNEAESIVDLFESAIADENEIYDMFGIQFIGHEDLKRLYMPENWKGFPLRKDYIQDDTRLAWNDDSDNT